MQEPPMTPEQKAAVMQFMGQTYGQAHKQDKMIVGHSGNLSPSSDGLKQAFEQTAKMPTVARQVPHHAPQHAQPEQPQQPQQVAPVTPEQAALELKQQAVQQPEVQPAESNQMDFDFREPDKVDKIIKLVEKQNLILKEISLKLDNGKITKTNKQKRIS